MSGEYEEIPELSEAGLPPPPPGFFAEFWRRVEAEEIAKAAQTPGDGLPSSVPASIPEGPPRTVLLQVRAFAEAVVEASGGVATEAEAVADEVVAYVDFAWHSLSLSTLARHSQPWEAYLVREIYRRWLATLVRSRSDAAGSVTESLARSRFLALADSASLALEDRQLLDHIYLHGLSVAETAIVFGLDRSELVGRIRRIWTAVREPAGVVAQGLFVEHRSGSTSVGVADAEMCSLRRFPTKGPAEVAEMKPVRPVGEVEPMSTRVKQQETFFDVPSEQLAAVHALMVASLVGRGLPIQDADDAAQNVLEKIARDPSSFADKLANLEEHKGWFVTVALNAYLMLLRGDRARRRREIQYWLSHVAAGGDIEHAMPEAKVVLALAAGGVLTARQRAYLEAVLVNRMHIEEIAELNRISPRAVRAVLARAAARLRRNLLRQAK